MTEFSLMSQTGKIEHGTRQKMIVVDGIKHKRVFY